MNRHGYKVRKFGREKAQREALIKGLAEELILRESIETTVPKAKAAAKYTEKLITKAKKAKGELHIRRQVISGLSTLEAANKLVDELSPKLGGRNSGYLRIKRTSYRRGDGVQLAKVSFVDNLSSDKPKAKAAGKTDKKTEEAETKEAQKQEKIQAKRDAQPQVKQVGSAPKRTGRRGNR